MKRLIFSLLVLIVGCTNENIKQEGADTIDVAKLTSENNARQAVQEKEQQAQKNRGIAGKMDNPLALSGTWAVLLKCVQSNCPEFTPGTAYNEVWIFTVPDTANPVYLVTVKASDNVSTNKGYEAVFLSGSLHGWYEESNGKVDVFLKMTTSGKMEGQRKVHKEDRFSGTSCLILYQVTATQIE